MKKKMSKKEEKFIQGIIREYAETWRQLEAYDRAENSRDNEISIRKEIISNSCPHCGQVIF